MHVRHMALIRHNNILMWVMFNFIFRMLKKQRKTGPGATLCNEVCSGVQLLNVQPTYARFWLHLLTQVPTEGTSTHRFRSSPRRIPAGSSSYSRRPPAGSSPRGGTGWSGTGCSQLRTKRVHNSFHDKERALRERPGNVDKLRRQMKRKPVSFPTLRQMFGASHYFLSQRMLIKLPSEVTSDKCAEALVKELITTHS